MKPKIALVLGATGLVGQKLIEKLTQDANYESLLIINRREVGYQHPKIQEKVVDFDQLDASIKQVNVTDIFCCIGTTIKTAGSKEAFRKVDYDIPVNFGKIAEKSGVENFIVISSLGADSNSNTFYSKVKGEMENKLKSFNLAHLTILRPSLLLGDRNEKRLGEGIAQVLFSVFGFLMIGPLKKYKAISADQVAKAMIYYASNPAETVIENKYLHEI
tara:strand:+ start:152 stop:802 length:651 start_codon:yes stop_codon:yes gene_type:complete